jgi:hypothetical protein
MKREVRIRTVASKFAKRLGNKLMGQIGRGRVMDVATDIVDYKEQISWSNTPHEIRSLTEKIHYIPARMNLTLNAVRLSRKSELDLRNALWRTLKTSFPTLEIKPTH